MTIETDEGAVDLDDETDSNINSDFRMLSSRGVYERIVDWRRNEDDGGVFIGQQLYGAYGRHGEYKHGMVTAVENGEASVAWVASGNTTFVPEPKKKWKPSEMDKLQAPWCELNLTHSETHGPSLGSRFRLKITEEDAVRLNRIQRESKRIKHQAIEAEISWNELIAELKLSGVGFLNAPAELFDVSQWGLIKVGKYEFVFYEGEVIAK